MTVLLKSLSSLELGQPEDFHPQVGAAWTALFEVEVTDVDHPLGGEVFSIEVCSAEWLSEELSHSALFACGRRLICAEYSAETLRAFVAKMVEDAARGAKTWDDFALRLNWYLPWEFDNYRA